MNTQTHILLASAVLIPAAPTLMPRIADDWRFKIAAVVAFFGAFAPDASLFFMWILGKIQGVPESIIFGDWYFSETWQRVGAETNSMPVYAAIIAISIVGMRLFNSGNKRGSQIFSVALTFAIAALLHTITDLPLHHDDGHPHFWPFSNWIYQSPVSYWDPRYHGSQWRIIELALSIGLIIFLWRRYKNRFSRACLAFTAISYALVALFWLHVF